MFPSKDLPAIVNDNNTVSAEPNNTKETNKKRIFPLTISGLQCATLSCVALVLLIIAIAISIGLLSVFVPNSNDDDSDGASAEIVALNLVLPITENSSNVLSLNNGPLATDNYLNRAQRNVLKTCLQTRFNSDNRTKTMTVLSIDSARGQYLGNNLNQTKNRKIIRQRVRRQTSSQSLLANQIQIVVSIQCALLISKVNCQQFIESVLDNGEPLRCTPSDVVITHLSPLRATKAVVVAKTQHWRQVGQVFLAFGLTSLVGLERQLRGKSAGLRTHSIVGTTSALILLVSKYGFSDVIHEGMVVLDPSRIAAQIISGISFLGAGLIITRQKAIRGLTTAASVWSAAAIGMAAGSGLWVLSLAVTGLHFIILLGFLPLEKRLPVFDTISTFHTKANENDDDDNDDDDDVHSV